MSTKVWFITGASRGFGALVAKAALARGDAVVATARNAAAIADNLGPHPQPLALSLDVTNEAQSQAAAARAIERFGRIDVLVNNAGYGLLGAVEEASAAEVERVFATNVFGLLNVTRAVLPRLRAQGSGHVINLSSIGGIASHTTAVEPGYFRTEFLSGNSLVSTASRIGDYAETVGAMRAFAARADGQQPGDPQRLAGAMLELVDAPEPPRRLPLGSDTVQRIGEKHRAVEAEQESWRTLALSTDFIAT